MRQPRLVATATAPELAPVRSPRAREVVRTHRTLPSRVAVSFSRVSRGRGTVPPRDRVRGEAIAPGLGAAGLHVGGFVQQRLQRRVLQRLLGFRVVEHPLEGRVDALCFPDLLHSAAVVPCVGGRRLLRAEDEHFTAARFGRPS